MLFLLAFLLFDPASQSSDSDLLRAALDSIAAGRLAEARTTLEQASGIAPNNPQVWLALTDVYARLHEIDRAREAGLHAIELAHAVPDWEANATIQNFVGKVNLATGSFPDALTHYREAIRLAPREETFRFDLAQALLGHEQFGEAVEVLENARVVFDNSSQIALALGVAYYGQRRFPEAAQAFLRTIELAPEIEQSYVFLGKMLDQVTDFLPEITKRFAAFQQAHSASPLGDLLLAKALAASASSTAEQETLLRHSISLSAGNWESHYQLGVLLETKHDWGNAAHELEQSAAINANDAATHYHLARVYDRLNRADAAAEQRAIHRELTARNKVTAGMERVQ